MYKQEGQLVKKKIKSIITKISESARKNSLVKTLNAMYLICSVNGEWYTV